MSQTSNAGMQSNAQSCSGSTPSTTSDQYSSASDSDLPVKRIQCYLEDPYTTTPYGSLNVQPVYTVPTHLNQSTTAGHTIPYVSHNLKPVPCTLNQLYQCYSNDTPSTQTIHAQGPEYANEHSNTSNIYASTTQASVSTTQAPAYSNQSTYSTAHPASSCLNTHSITDPTQPNTVDYVSQTTQPSHSYMSISTTHPLQPASLTYSSHTSQPSQPSDSSLTTHPYAISSAPYATHSYDTPYTSDSAALVYPPSIVQAVYDMRTKLRDFDNTFNRSDQQ